jgi:hypothetical protein
LGTFGTCHSENFSLGSTQSGESKYNFEIEVNFISKSIDDAEELFLNFKQSNPKKTIGQSKFLILPTDSGREFWKFQSGSE